MKKILKTCILAGALALTSIHAMAATSDWTLYDPNISTFQCTAASGSCTVIDLVAVRTQKSGITIRRVEYTSTAPITGTEYLVDADPIPYPPNGFCPRDPLINFYISPVDAGIRQVTPTYSLVVDQTGLYTDSGSIAVKIKAGTRLSVVSLFAQELLITAPDYTRTDVRCTTPPGNIVIQYTTP